MVGCIVAIPGAAWAHKFQMVGAMSALVWMECGALAMNRWRCPLTNVAEHFAAGDRPNFDIYLPEWLAQHNKTIFGTLFILSEAIALILWIGRR